MKLATLLAGLFAIAVLPANAQAPSPEIAPTAPQTVESMITLSAEKYAVERRVLARLLNCESGLNPRAIGDNGTSFGIAQFHHPERDWGITVEQAFDPEFAIDLTARSISKGLGPKWTCY